MPLSQTKLEDDLASIFTDTSTDTTAKKKFFEIIEVIEEYAADVIPPSLTTNVIKDTIEFKLRGLSGAAFSGNGSMLGQLARALPDISDIIIEGMLPLYKGIAPLAPGLQASLQQAFFQNSSQGRGTLASAKAVAEVIHKYFAKGRAIPASGFVGFPVINSWARRKSIRRDSSKYSDVNWIPEDRINKPNANRLRSVLRALGYGEKSAKNQGSYRHGEISNGGDLHPAMAELCIWLFSYIGNRTDEVESLPSSQTLAYGGFGSPVDPSKVGLALTGGNDFYHHTLGYVSNHTRGLAMDFVVYGVSSTGASKHNTTLKAFDRILHGIQGNPANKITWSDGKRYAVFRFINEFIHPSAAATAGHYHFIAGIKDGTKESVSYQRNGTWVMPQRTKLSEDLVAEYLDSGGQRGVPPIDIPDYIMELFENNSFPGYPRNAEIKDPTRT